MIRCELYTAKIPDKLWCHVLQHSNFVWRRVCAHPKMDYPYFMWHNKKLDFKKMHVFGCTVYVPENHNKKLGDRIFPATSLWYRPSTSVILNGDQFNNIFDWCHRGRIDDHTFRMKDLPSQLLLDNYIINNRKHLPHSEL